MSTITKNPKREAEATVMVKELFQRFKKESGMKEEHWVCFCKRYSNRNVTTVVEAISGRYGKLPRCASKVIKKELIREVAILQMQASREYN